jgi:hypothetical protein
MIQRAIGTLGIFFFFSSGILAQNWEPLGGGASYMVRGVHVSEANNKLYAYGLFFYIGDSVLVNFIAEWDGNEWKDMNGGHNTSNHPITGVLTFDENILVYGQFPTFNSAMDAKFNAIWDGNEWNSFAEVNGAILFDNYNDSLLAFGTFDTINGVAISGGLALYDGMQWHDFDTMQFHNGSNGYLTNTAVYNNELYVAGNFTRPNGLNEIAKWDGEKFVALENGILGDSWVDKMLVYKDELYVAGHFFKIHGNVGNGIMKWDGEKWSDLNKGLNMPFNGHVRDMVIYEDDLIIAGTFFGTDDVLMQNIARWDGEKFCNFRDDYRGTVTALTVYNDELIAVCRDTMDGDTTQWIAKWVGGNQTTACDEVLSLTDHENTPIQHSSSKLILAPNPASEKLTVTIEPSLPHPAKVFCYDTTGRMIKVWEIEDSITVLDIHDLSTGTYLLTLQSDTAVYKTKFMKQ